MCILISNTVATYREIRDIVIGKLVDHTVGEDYEDLSERLFGDGNCFNSNEVRKRMYGMKTIIEAIDRESIDGVHDVNVISQLDDKIIELKKERQRFADQRREFNKIVSLKGRAERLEDQLVSAANSLESSIGKISFDSKDDCDIGSEAVLVLCDWHYGMKTKNIWNEYDTDVCVRRVQRVIELASERIKRHRCNKIHIVILGDLIHGAIHTSARVASEEMVCDQIMQVSEILAQAVEFLSMFANEVNVYTTYGNHARVVQKKEDSIHRDNLERIIPWWLHQRLKDYRNINIINDFENEFIMFNVFGYNICASHGDLDFVKSSTKTLTTLMQKKLGIELDYILLADKHHRESFESMGVSAMICGALCGSDDYANSKRLYSVPEQAMFIISKDIGLDAEYRIQLD